MEKDEDYTDPTTLPIYKKGKEIYEVVFKITELFEEGNEELNFIKGCMICDASLLSIKIAGVCNIEFYDLKMEAAVIARKAAQDLRNQYVALEIFGFEEVEYFEVVFDLIEEYRLLFIDWVASFDQWDYVIDRWGLFNPPGVSPFDTDPDSDVPF